MTVTGTTPSVPAKLAQLQRPATIPSGSPTAPATSSSVSVCEMMMPRNWRRGQPEGLQDGQLSATASGTSDHGTRHRHDDGRAQEQGEGQRLASLSGWR